MIRLKWCVVVSASALATIGWARAGGWAVVSVEQMPEYLVVGKAQEITFNVRQHGVERLTGLKPTIVARKGFRSVQGRVWELRDKESYRASLTVPDAGDWSVTIESGFGRSKGALLPWRAVDSTRQMAPLAPAERGRQMFAARGCVTCHVHGDVGITGELSGFGPDLTTRRFAADYLAKFLADPTIKPADGTGKRMPNPVLSTADIGPLVAFINSERRLSSR